MCLANPALSRCNPLLHARSHTIIFPSYPFKSRLSLVGSYNQVCPPNTVLPCFCSFLGFVMGISQEAAGAWTHLSCLSYNGGRLGVVKSKKKSFF